MTSVTLYLLCAPYVIRAENARAVPSRSASAPGGGNGPRSRAVRGASRRHVRMSRRRRLACPHLRHVAKHRTFPSSNNHEWMIVPRLAHGHAVRREPRILVPAAPGTRFRSIDNPRTAPHPGRLDPRRAARGQRRGLSRGVGAGAAAHVALQHTDDAAHPSSIQSSSHSARLGHSSAPSRSGRLHAGSSSAPCLDILQWRGGRGGGEG